MTLLCAAFSFKGLYAFSQQGKVPFSENKWKRITDSLYYMTICLGYPHPDFKSTVFKSVSEALSVCVSNSFGNDEIVFT